MLSQRADLPDGHPDRATLRTRSIVAGLPLARRLAAAWRGRGEPLDDLNRVAALALMRAVDGYNPSRQVAFVSYAVPTIVGALKRHFRGSTWRVRVPPGIKDLAVSIAPTSARLTQELGRPPTLQELADSVDATEEDVVVALNSWLAHHPDSLDALSTVGGGERLSPIDSVGEVDANVDKVTDLHDLGRLLAALTVRQLHSSAMTRPATRTPVALASPLCQAKEVRAQIGLRLRLTGGDRMDEVTPRGAALQPAVEFLSGKAVDRTADARRQQPLDHLLCSLDGESPVVGDDEVE